MPSEPVSLKHAEDLYEAGNYSAAAREAEGLFRQPQPEKAESLRQHAVVLSLFAYAAAGEFERGWQLVLEADSAADHPDFCYVACCLAYHRGDYEQVDIWGRRYIERSDTALPQERHFRSADKTHEILNTLGCAARDRGECQLAVDYFEQARRLAPDFPLPYLNQALVLKRTGSLSEAQALVSAGLRVCPSSEELRLFRDGLLTDRTISVCMIVKDEEEMLAAALESVRPVAHEIIVVDTGSTDRTVAMAEAAGARVYRHAWEDDFSKARNQSLQYAHGDWVLILDADERLCAESVPVLRKLAQSCLHDVISFSVYNVDMDTDQVSFLPSLRMFRNRRGYRYQGRVHNQLVIPPGTSVQRTPVRIDHYGYTTSLAARRGKYERTARLLERELKDNPDDAFAHFNMAQVLRSGNREALHARKIVQHAQRALDLIAKRPAGHRHVQLMAYHQLASASMELGDFDAALQACGAALELKPDYVDALFTLAQIHSRCERPAEARHAWQEYLRLLDQYDEVEESYELILLHLRDRTEAHYGLGRAEEALGHGHEALGWYRQVLTGSPGHLDTWLRVGLVCQSLGRYEEAALAFAAELTAQPDSLSAHTGLGEIRAREHRWQEALEHFRAALELEPHRFGLHASIAACARKLGLLELAEEHLAQAHQAMGPQHATANGHGQVLARDPAPGRVRQVLDSRPPTRGSGA